MPSNLKTIDCAVSRAEPVEPADLAELADLACEVGEALALARAARDVWDAEDMAIRLERIATAYQRIVDKD